MALSVGWEGKIRNTIIYLTGFPASGKLTVANALAGQINARIIHNHVINDPILQIVRRSGADKIPDEAWQETDKIRQIVFDAMVNLANSEENFILTNVLVNAKGDQKLFDQVEHVSVRRKATFVPIGLKCEAEILLNRVQNLDREHRQKLTAPDRLSEILERWNLLPIRHKNVLEIDNSNVSAEQCASLILDHVEKL